MASNPVKFVCPACGFDASDFVDGLIRSELGQSAKPTGVAIPIPLATQPVRKPLTVQAHAPEPAKKQTVALEPISTCPRHPGEIATDRCYVCSKPICAKCMELFGYLCSPLCKAKADSHGIAVPVFEGQRTRVEARLWRKVVWVGSTVGGVLLLLAGFWFWYSWFGSLPKVAFSLRFAEPSYSGQSVICGKNQNQLVFLHGDTLARQDLKEKKQIWSCRVIDQQQIQRVVEQRIQATQTLINKANNEAWENVPKMPSREQLTKQMERDAAASLTLHVRGQSVWVASPGKLVHYDWETGKQNKELAVQDGAGGLISRGDELLVVETGSGKPVVTHIGLESCESRTEDLSEPGMGTNAAGAPSTIAGQKPTSGQSLAGLPLGMPGQDAGRPIDPAKAAEQAQHLPFPARVALPATLAASINQERALNELNDDGRHAGAGAGFEPQSSFSLIPTRNGFVEYSVKLLEAHMVPRSAMKAAPARSVLDGNLTAGNSMDAASEFLNELQRSRGGGVVQEDMSRYQVTVKRPGSDEAWTGEVIGQPRLYPLQSVNVVAANKMIIVLNKSNKQLWQSSLLYDVVGDSSALDAESATYGQGPCVERKGSLYVFDQGVLTAFDLTNGLARWRLQSVGIAGLFFDDNDMMYVNTTTASHDTLKYSRQIDLSRKVTSVVQKVDCRKGNIVWTTEGVGLVNYVSGKFIFTVQSYTPEEEDEDNPYRPETGFEASPYMRIRRINPSNGHEMWAYFQQRAPLDVGFDKNTIRLVFKKEVQVLRFFTF